MDLPAARLLCLEQMDRSLEDYTQDFLDLACLVHYSDDSLSVFFHTSLSEQAKARLPANGPCEDFSAYVEWVLVNKESEFTIGPEEDTNSPTPNSEPSLTLPCEMDTTPEPTVDREPAQRATEPRVHV